MKELDKTLPILISFSGGRTSAFMTKWILESEKYKDQEKVVVFANTGKEREETLQFIDRCDKEWNLNVIWIEYNPLEEYGKKNWFKIVDFETASRDGEPFEKFIKKERVPNSAYPNCSGRLKQLPIHNLMKDMCIEDYYTAIGIRLDEKHRVGNWDEANKKKYIYPLITDFRVDSLYIRKFWESQCFDLGLKDYEGNCDMCWKKSNRKLLTLINENPNMINWWNEMEIKYGEDEYHFFRDNKSAIDLIDESQRPFRKAVDSLELHNQQGNMFDNFMDQEESCFCK